MGEEPPANFYQCYKMRNFLTVVTIVLYLKTSLISAGKKVQDLQIIVEVGYANLRTLLGFSVLLH